MSSSNMVINIIIPLLLVFKVVTVISHNKTKILLYDKKYKNAKVAACIMHSVGRALPIVINSGIPLEDCLPIAFISKILHNNIL